MPTIRTIAIIDDDESIRIGLRFLVTALGYDAFAFASAADFLQSDQFRGTSCVISDVRMPAMSGIQLQAHLRNTGCEIPIILITAVPEGSVRQQALDDGAVAFLTKPLDDHALSSYLENAVSRSLRAER